MPYTVSGGGGLPATWGTVTAGTSSTTFNYTVNFTSSSSTAWNTFYSNGQIRPPYQRTQQEIDDARRIEARRVEETRQRTSERDTASQRAKDLLMTLLNEQQRESYEHTCSFEIIGSLGTRYRINRGTNGNVEWLTPDGESGGRLCAHPTMVEHWLPMPDVHAAQMLALMTDEAAWLRLANVHAGRRPELVAQHA